MRQTQVPKSSIDYIWSPIT